MDNDWWVDEPIYEICEEHQRVRPCYLCRLEAAEYRGECEREERYDEA